MMRITSKINMMRKGILLYRGIRYRKGFGVHSPFVYNLITRVIEERCPYYCFDDIELIRKKMLFCGEQMKYRDWRRRNGRTCLLTVGQIVAREAINPKHGALLFRLTNYFKSERILQIGTSVGLSALYLTSYALSGITCIALERIPVFADITRMTLGKARYSPVDLRPGDYPETLPKALADLSRPDLVFFNIPSEPQLHYHLFEACLRQADSGTVFVFEGIRINREMKEFWEYVRQCAEVTVTIDLYSAGIVFFNKKLYKQNYIVYF